MYIKNTVFTEYLALAKFYNHMEQVDSSLFYLQKVKSLFPDQYDFMNLSNFHKKIINIKGIQNFNDNESNSITDDFFIQTNEDKFKGLTFIEDSRSSTYTGEKNDKAYFHPYFYLKENETKSDYFRARIQYKSNDWLFLERVFLLIDGKKYEFKGEVKRDNTSSTVLEWMDVKINTDLLEEIIQHHKNGGNISFRLVGDSYESDYILNNWQIKGIINIFNVYYNHN